MKMTTTIENDEWTRVFLITHREVIIKLLYLTLCYCIDLISLEKSAKHLPNWLLLLLYNS